MAHNVDKLKSVPFGQKLLTKLSNTYKELPIMIKNANNNQMNNKFNNKMKRNSNNKNMHHKNPQAAMPNSNTNFGGVQHNNYYANPINNNIKYRNVNNDMMNTNNIQNFGNNYLGNINNNNTNNYWNSMNNVNSMNSMNLLNNINPQMDNINPSYNNSYANRNPNHHMPPMAVNQYVNQVFYNMGNNNFVPNPTTSQMNIPNIPNNFKNYGKM